MLGTTEPSPLRALAIGLVYREIADDISAMFAFDDE
jgi:hypothetical protein